MRRRRSAPATLNSAPICAGSIRRAAGVAQRLGLLGRLAGGQAREPGLGTEPQQQRALRQRAPGDGAAGDRAASASAPKSTCAETSASPGAPADRPWRGRAPPAASSPVEAGRGRSRSAAPARPARQPGGDLLGHGLARRRQLEHRTQRRAGVALHRACRGTACAPAAVAKAEAAVRRQRHQALAPAGQRAARTGAPAGRRGARWRPAAAARRRAPRPARRASCTPIAEQPSRPAAPRRRRLVSTRCERVPRRWKPGTMPSPRQASAISVPRPGPISTSRTATGAAEVEPALRQRQAQQLAEDLADLGCGDEVALAAERVAGGVVAERRMRPAPAACRRRRRSARGRGSSGRSSAGKLAHRLAASRRGCAGSATRPARSIGTREQLAHGDAAQQIAELRVGLAEELDR